ADSGRPGDGAHADVSVLAQAAEGGVHDGGDAALGVRPAPAVSRDWLPAPGTRHASKGIGRRLGWRRRRRAGGGCPRGGGARPGRGRRPRRGPAERPVSPPAGTSWATWSSKLRTGRLAIRAYTRSPLSGRPACRPWRTASPSSRAWRLERRLGRGPRQEPAQGHYVQRDRQWHGRGWDERPREQAQGVGGGRAHENAREGGHAHGDDEVGEAERVEPESAGAAPTRAPNPNSIVRVSIHRAGLA